jgi:hypothetical protein
MREMCAVAAAAPKLDGESARRAAAALAARGAPHPIDLAAARSAFSAMMDGAWQAAPGSA